MSLRIAAAVLALAFSAAAHAQSRTETSTVEVSAEILSVCKFSTSSALNFGPLDPSNPKDEVATATLKFNCSAGTAIRADISTNSGDFQGLTGNARMTRAGGADTLGYTLSLSSRTFTGAGFTASKDLSLELTASLPGSAYSITPAGTYRDTVTVKWNY
jgi:spore coat protein U-like protein